MPTIKTKPPAKRQTKPASRRKSSKSNITTQKDTLFGRFARTIASVCGKPATFLTMVSLVIVWAVTGPVFDYSETWQLVINTGTTIITFLMVFVIQNTQNKDTEAMQLKLDADLCQRAGA